MSNVEKNIHDIVTNEEYETLLAFHDIAEEVLGSRLEKIIVFGRKSKKEKSNALDLLFLLSNVTQEDSVEVAQIAEDLTENSTTQIAPLVMELKKYEACEALDHPLIHDIKSTGVELIPPA